MDTGAPHNPFSSHMFSPADGGYIFPEGQSLESVISRLEQAGWRGELIGPHGAGKSTMLTDISRVLSDRNLRVVRWHTSNLCRLPPTGWLLDVLKRADVIAFDGAERLVPGVLRLLRIITRWNGCGLIVTTHNRLGFGAGIIVNPDADALARKFGRSHLGPLLEKHDGNGRLVWMDLYDEFEKSYREKHQIAVKKSE